METKSHAIGDVWLMVNNYWVSLLLLRTKRVCLRRTIGNPSENIVTHQMINS